MLAIPGRYAVSGGSVDDAGSPPFGSALLWAVLIATLGLAAAATLRIFAQRQ